MLKKRKEKRITEIYSSRFHCAEGTSNEFECLDRKWINFHAYMSILNILENTAFALQKWNVLQINSIRMKAQEGIVKSTFSL